jgi:hypothetical protein
MIKITQILRKGIETFRSNKAKTVKKQPIYEKFYASAWRVIF